MGREGWKGPTIAGTLVAVGALAMWLGTAGLCHRIGEALFIAGALAFVVDPYVKRHLLKEASRDIFHHLLGFGLPEPIRDRIKSLAFETRLYRENLTIRCRLEVAGEATVLRCEVNFDVVNPTPHELIYRHSVENEKSDKPKIIDFASFPPGGSGYQEGAAAATTIVEEPDVLGYGKDQAIPAKGRCAFRTTYQLRVPASYYYVFFFGAPTVGAVLELEHPQELVVGATKPDIPRRGGRFEYSRLFMPGEHINIRWTRTGITPQPPCPQRQDSVDRQSSTETGQSPPASQE